MDRECGTYGGETLTGFWGGKLRERNLLEDTPLERNNIKMYFKDERRDMDWTGVARDRDRRWALLNVD